MPVKVNATTPESPTFTQQDSTDGMAPLKGAPKAEGESKGIATADASHPLSGIDPVQPPLGNPTVQSGPVVSDPNAVVVQITDNETPIVVLYGPPACGKTMTLVRLTRYLKKIGLQVEPDRNFRDAQDPSYKDLCDNFDNIIDSNDAADSTALISFLLVTVRDSSGSSICQILEAPGEAYYNPGSPDSPGVNGNSYRPYISKIINTQNRKIWAVILDADPKNSKANQKMRSEYVNNIKFLNGKLNKKSKVLFVYNKVDTISVKKQGDTIKVVSQHYPGIFEPFRNQNPITRIFKKYNCDLVRFSTGDYNKKMDGRMAFTESGDEYPKKLWGRLYKMIRG